MFRRIAILLSIAGLALAGYVVATAQPPTPAPPPAQPPSSNPYARGIVAIGLVEPATRAVDVAAPEPGRVVEVFVEVNDRVKKGDPLFRLDAIPVESELLRARAAEAQASAEVARLEAWPRPEDFPPVEAEVEESSQRLADAEDRLASLEKAGVAGGASETELQRARFSVSTLRATLINAQARLARLKSGSWDQDLLVARAALAARQADSRAIEMRLDRYTVRAPIDGTVLKRNIEPGESAAGGGAPSPGPQGESDAPLVLGDLSAIHVRALIDEEDAPLLRLGAHATGRVRGPFKTSVPLEMLRIEPMARPKNQITGGSTELIDTRVIEVVLLARPEPGGPTLYPGQVVDVFIDAGDAVPPTPPAPTPPSAASR
ncbi:MAG TPA: hypothetical protein DEB06_04625 [Phycisphaerales bacterium]|nr:hypothetical protein [Phycisphaerales bacterium]